VLVRIGTFVDIYTLTAIVLVTVLAITIIATSCVFAGTVGTANIPTSVAFIHVFAGIAVEVIAVWTSAAI